MAVVRARSSPPYALIVFVFLTVIASGIAIYLSTRVSDMEKKMGAAQDQLAETRVSSDNVFADNLAKVRRTKTESLLSVAASQIDTLKSMIEDSKAKTPAEVVLDANNVLDAAGKSGKTLRAAIEDTIAQVQADKTEIAGLQQANKDLQGHADQMASNNTKSSQDSLQTVASMKDQLAAANAALADARKTNEDNTTKSQGDLTTEKQNSEALLRRGQLVNQDLTSKIGVLQQEVDVLKQEIKRAAAPTVAIAPAGHVIRATAGTNECYIDLGAKQHVVVGLTFSVHDPLIGVKSPMSNTNGTQEGKGDTIAAGKGSIEVLQVGENESLCRIDRTAKGQIIQAGDLISNPVYQNSLSRKSHFVVFGDFDLDGDGVATAVERDRVIHMIQAWGGVVDKELTPQTDFLVLGTEPAASSNPGDGQAGSVGAERDKIRSKYQDLIVDAKQSSVPILNANRFLAMIGYTSTTIAH